jgi:transposase-like protein
MAGRGRQRHHAGMRRQYTSKQRSELVELVTAGRATVSEAAARMGVAPSTAYYWVRRGSPVSKARGLAEPTFVRLVPTSAIHAAITLRVEGAEIQVGRDFDRDLLRAVVEALRGGAA